MNRLEQYAAQAEERSRRAFDDATALSSFHTERVIRAMQHQHLSQAHFAGSSGYGYDDAGREALGACFAELFEAEDAVAGTWMTSGTHALHIALSGNLRPGDELLYISGMPYDTLQGVLGIRPSTGSLAEYGVLTNVVDLKPDGSFDVKSIMDALHENTKMVAIQRSRGYSLRPSIPVRSIADITKEIKSVRPDIVIMVDNCYGEFVEEKEPTAFGVDLCVGSLIKNAGGGLAPCGGYIAGKKEYVDAASYRMTAPGLGREVGAVGGETLRNLMTGLFLAPDVVRNAKCGAVFAANLFSMFGFAVDPLPDAYRTDIIEAITLGDPERLLSFARGIQKASPVDAHVTPVASPMPGYDDDVVMAAGTFISGSSIELSCDAPLRPPYVVFLQGGLSYAAARYGIMGALRALLDDGLLPEVQK